MKAEGLQQMASNSVPVLADMSPLRSVASLQPIGVGRRLFQKFGLVAGAALSAFPLACPACA